MLLHLRHTTSSLRTLLLRRNRATQASSSPVVVVGVVASTIETTTRRTYMGGAGEMKSRRDDARPDDAVAAREQALWDKARPRYDAIMERHVRLPPEEDDVVDVDVAPDARRRKRLVYRSKQRGWLEVDLLLGTWASINVPSLNADELDEFEKFVNMETIDIYNVLTLRSDVPEEMGGGVAGDGKRSLVEKIQDWCKESPLGKADKEKYDEVKTKNNLI